VSHDISENELRALVRESIARLSAGPQDPPRVEHTHRHASHVVFAISSGGDADGACLIEPAVRCNHCGYCQSYGH